MPCGKFGPGYCITFLQRLDDELRKQLSEQNPLGFTRVIHANGLGPGSPGRQYYW